MIVSELQNAQKKALPDSPYPRYPIVAHVERFQPGRQVSPVHGLHSAEKVVADVQVPQGRHGRKYGDIEYLETSVRNAEWFYIIQYNMALQDTSFLCLTAVVVVTKSGFSPVGSVGIV